MGDNFAEGYAIGRDSVGGNGYGMFGNDWSWWIVILLIFGLGRGGFGNVGGVMDGYVLTSDFANIERKLDTVNNGLCDGFYAQNTNMHNGFSGVQQSLCQGFSGVTQAINTNGYETRSDINQLGYNLQNCCCQTQRAIDSVNYNMATNSAALQNSICSATRDIIDNQNANYRALHDEIVANKLEAKNDRIAEQQAQITALQLKASQEAQNAYLINQLKPCPVPAYLTCPPNQSVGFFGNAGYGYGYNGCGCNTCGC